MDSVNTSSTSRTSADSPLEPIPSDIWTCIVVRHIALREGRTITSLACVSSLFAQWTRPHLKPVALYRELDSAREGTAETARRQAMSTLYDLPGVDQAHRLELFLLVSDTLWRHFPGAAIEPHISAMLASMEHLPRADQPKALLGLLDNHGTDPLCATRPRYLAMAARIGVMTPSADQASLARILSSEMTDVNGKEFLAKAQAFLDMCRRLQPTHRAEVLSHLLQVGSFLQAMSYPFQGDPIDREQVLHNRAVLMWGIHDCLQSIQVDALPVEERTVLLGRALFMPAFLKGADEADRMAISLLRMVPPGEGDFYSRNMEGLWGSFGECVENLLEQVFEHGPRQSIHRFQRLYAAMAHLPPSCQIGWMRSILTRCAKNAEAGVTPALIVATMQAALALPGVELQLLYDLFAVCLNPGPLRKMHAYPFLQPAAIELSERPDYLQRFDANCHDLMHALGDAAPEAAARLLAGINSAYTEVRTLEMLPSPGPFRTELYGRFLEHALAFLQSLPPADAAGCLLQWRLPLSSGPDARATDDRVIALLSALQSMARDSDAAPPAKQQAALAALMEDVLIDPDNSPARNRRLLAALSVFPDDVCAGVLSHLLATRYLSVEAFDVLFASIVEAAGRLPDALRCAVLTTATAQLQRFPILRRLHDTDPKTLLEMRQCALDRRHPGLKAMNPELHAYLQPGCVSRMEGLTLLLDAMQTLPAPHRAGLLRLLSKRDTFFAFANVHIAVTDQLECSMGLLSGILSLPHDVGTMRADVYAVWIKHFTYQFQSEIRETAENRLLASLFALPAREGRPLFEAYVDRIGYAPSKAALRQRALANWAGAD